MWNCSASSSLLLPLSDDYIAVKCEVPSNSPARTIGFDKMLAADYELFNHLSFSPSPQNLQSPTFFTTRSSDSYLGESSMYGAGARPAFAQFSYAQPTDATSAAVILFAYLKTLVINSKPTMLSFETYVAGRDACLCQHLVRWTAAGERTTGDSGGGGFRGSKRLKTTAPTAATTQGPRHGLNCHAKPRNQPAKATCKRSQKLGDKITALQQLVSPYGKTDTASVLQEAAACIRQLHHQIQILTAPYPPGTRSSSAPSQQDAGGEGTTTELRRRGLCVAAVSPAIVSLVAEGAAGHGHRRTDVEENQRRIWFGNR